MRFLMSSRGSSRPGLRGDQAEHDDLVALRQKAQRLEAAGAVAVVFQEVAVVIALGEQALRHRLVTAGGDEGGAEIAAADMGGDGHVGGLGLQRLVDAGGVGLLQMIDVEAAILGLRQLFLGAEIGPGRVVPLQVTATGGVERLDRILIGDGEIVEDGVTVGVSLLAHRAGLEPEMHHARRRDGHFRHHLGVRLQELEVLQHRMIGKSDLAGDLDAARLGLHALKLNAVIELVDFHAVEHAEEIEVPPRAAKLAIGGKLKADLFLLLDDLLDLAVFNLFELSRRNRALLALRARLLDRRGAQNAADMVGAEWRLGSLRHGFLREAPAGRAAGHLPGLSFGICRAIACPAAIRPAAASHA